MELLESENGFVTYAMNQNTFYIAEIFVRKHVRGSLEAYKLYKKCLDIAKNNGCLELVGSVDSTTSGWQYSERLMSRLGFERSHSEQNLTFFKKKIT